MLPNNAPTPKSKVGTFIGEFFKCHGIGHIRDHPSKSDRKVKLIHMNFLFSSYEDGYESRYN